MASHQILGGKTVKKRQKSIHKKRDMDEIAICYVVREEVSEWVSETLVREEAELLKVKGNKRKLFTYFHECNVFMCMYVCRSKDVFLPRFK